MLCLDSVILSSLGEICIISMSVHICWFYVSMSLSQGLGVVIGFLIISGDLGKAIQFLLTLDTFD